MATHRPPLHVGRRSRWYLYGIPPVLAIGLIVTVVVLFLDNRTDQRVVDADMCPLDAADIAHRAVLLLDLRKPLGENQRVLLADSLRSVTMAQGANAELRVFALAGNDAAPRRLVGRLCKPYDNAQLAFEGAKDSGVATRDCDDLPAQVPTRVREFAQQFCAQRQALQADVEELAATLPSGPVENAFLVEALEETSLELASMSPPRSLYILSDMMQHAAWYSQLEIGWSGWTFEEFTGLRQAQDALVGPRPATVPGVDVTIYYVPRQGVTDQLRTRMVHQRFWRRYVAEAFETTAVFVEEPVHGGYEIAPLMERTTEADLIAEERANLQREREEAARLLEQVEEQRAALEAARQAAADEEAERARLAELAAAADPPPPAPVPPQEPVATTAGPADDAAAPAVDSADADEADANDAGSDDAGSDATGADDALALEAGGVAAEPAQSPEPSPPRRLADAASPPAPEQLAEAVPAADPVPPSVPATQPQEPSLPGCPLDLKPRFRGSAEYPPGVRWAYASATIAVRYVVDENGHTVDDDVVVVAERSTANPAEYLRRFGEHARRIVAGWEFTFDDAEPCTRRQELTTAVEFSRRTRPPTVPVR